MTDKPTPLTDAITRQYIDKPHDSILTHLIWDHAARMERDRAMLREALDRLLVVAGEGTSKGRALDLLPQGTIDKASAALAATEEK